MTLLNILQATPKDDPPRLKVRLTTSAYQTKNGVIFQKQLYLFRNPNPEHIADWFKECVQEFDEPDGLIVNLYIVEDGIYELYVSTPYSTEDDGEAEWSLRRWEDA